MSTAMILHAFTAHNSGCWRNRPPNEILFTAQSDTGNSFSAQPRRRGVPRPNGSF